MRHSQLHLDEDEKIIFQVRRHWFTLGIEVFGVFLLMCIPLFLYSMLFGIFFGESEIPPLCTSYFIALYIIWLIIMWVILFSVWTNHYLDVWILTNKRIIAIDQRGLFNRTTSSFRLERLQDVTVSINGIIPTFLDYGMLEIQTAGEERNFKIFGLPQPEDLKTFILDAAGKTRNTDI